MLAINAVASFFYVRRANKPVPGEPELKGCLVGSILFWAFMFIVLCLLSGFTIACPIIAYNWYQDQKAVYAGSEYYDAEIIDTVSQEYISQRHRRAMRRYYPVYQFVVASGDTIVIQAEGTDLGATEIGSFRKVYYNAELGRITRFEATSLILPIGMTLLFFPLLFGSISFYMYSFSYDMTKLKRLMFNIFMKFYIPVAGLSFYAILIYSFFYGNPARGESGYYMVKSILLLVILILTFVIGIVIKKTLQKNSI
jgi:hypothetical protein